MVLIFGGAYQGKLDFALAAFDKTEADVFRCPPCSGGSVGEIDREIDWEKSIIYGIENWVYDCAGAGVEAREILASRRADLTDKILIASDVSQGLVPMDPLDRAYREMMGRTLLYLASEAEQVHRVFCGLGQRLK